MVLLAASSGAMLLLVRGVALGAYRYGSAGSEILYGTLNDDTVNGYGGGGRIYGFDGDDMLRGGTSNDAINADFGNDFVSGGSGNDAIRVGADEAMGYVECGPEYDRVYLDDKDRYTTDCEILTPVD